jgi:hypothetical protein
MSLFNRLKYHAAYHALRSCHGPVIVGATGGSGTRAVQQALDKAGIYMGNDLPDTCDANCFVPYLTDHVNDLLSRHGAFCEYDERDATQRRHLALLKEQLTPYLLGARGCIGKNGWWGWKQPRSILILPLLLHLFPKMYFLHIIRDGRDMAFAPNQNLPQVHYEAYMHEPFMPFDPLSIIRMWSRLNSQAADWCETHLSTRYKVLRFEDLCNHPESEMRSILKWLGLPDDDSAHCVSHVRKPPSIERWQEYSTRLTDQLQQVSEHTLKRFNYL